MLFTKFIVVIAVMLIGGGAAAHPGHEDGTVHHHVLFDLSALELAAGGAIGLALGFAVYRYMTRR